MQVFNPNNVKIYQLSSGKSVPEWLSEKKRRLLQKNKDFRMQIQLIQDFEMPCVSTNVKISKDGQYILVTGTYKPRVRCFDVNQLAMKFERCMDSEIVQFQILSDDYSKMVFLHADRYVELHVQYGRYYRVRIPKFGHDITYNPASCDLYCVGASSEVYRLNLEQGRFLDSFQTQASSINKCIINPVHQLLVCGTNEGQVEAWDPRSRTRVGILDCALESSKQRSESTVPSITALSFKDGLKLAIGTSSGQVLLYDIRSNSPYIVKDHMYEFPIKNIDFNDAQGIVISVDKQIVRLWDQNTGKLFTAIQPETNLNDLCIVPNTGLLFLANEDRKVLSYYIPSLGPVPRWCSFLDSLTEELEESNQDIVYDDYKFVTKQEVEDLGLGHLIGSSLLRAYMHGYFMDIRLYYKAKAIAEPFVYNEYRKKKIREMVNEKSANRVKINKVPKINKGLALKLAEKEALSKKQKKIPSLLTDKRFKDLFENPNYEIDEQIDEYKLLHPVISKHDSKQKNKQVVATVEESESEGKPSSEESESDESSDDGKEWKTEVKKQYKLIRKQKQMEESDEDAHSPLQPHIYQLKQNEHFSGRHQNSNFKSRATLGERLENSVSKNVNEQKAAPVGNSTMTFTLNKKRSQKKREEEMQRHLEERKMLQRSAKDLKGKRRKSNLF